MISIEIPRRTSRLVRPPGRYLVESGLVFRFSPEAIASDAPLVDDVAGPGCVLWVGAEDTLVSPTGALLQPASGDLAHGEPRRLRKLLWIRSGTARDAVVRSLHMLTELCGSVLPVELLQRDIAKIAGVRHETVNRVLKDMEKAGALRNDRRQLFVTGSV